MTVVGGLRRWARVVAVYAGWAAAGPAPAQPVLEAVSVQAVASAPDLRVGDRMLRARWRDGEMALDSVAAVTRLQWQVLPRGAVEVEIERDGQRRWVAWTPMSADLRPGPTASASEPLAELDRRLLALRSTREQPQSEAGQQAWQQAWELVSATPGLEDWRALTAVYGARSALMGPGAGDEVLRRLEFLDGLDVDPVLRAAGEEARVRVWMERRELQRIVDLLAPLAARAADGAPLHAWEAQLLVRLAWARGQQGAFAQALAEVERARAALAALCADCLETAVALDAAAQLHSRLDRPERAQALQEELYRAWQGLMPGSLNAAFAGLKLAGYASSAGDKARALAVAEESAALCEALAAPGYYRGAAANVLGTLLVEAGRIDAAEERFRHGLEVLGDSAPERSVRVQLQHNLGLLMKEDGRLAQAHATLLAAEREYRAQKHDRGSEYAAVAANVANLERLRGDYDAAAQWLQRSLDALADAPGMGPRRAYTLIDQAELELQRGRRAQALAAFDAAQAAVAQTAPGCDCRAQADLHQGRALLDADAERALALLERAGGAFARARQPLDQARSESARALALSALGRHAAARKAMRQALGRWQQAFPDGVERAEALHGLGRIEAADGRPRAARQAWCAAARALDRASLSLGADDYAQMRFRARFVEVYRDCMLATLDADGAQAALEVWQRGRRLAWRRGLEQRAHADSALARLGREYERAWQALDSPGADPDARAAAMQRAQELRLQRSEALARLDVPAAAEGEAAALAPAADELLLVYALGESRSLVFVLRAGAPAEALPLALDRSRLRRAVREWRALIGRRDAHDLDAIRRGGDALYRQLLGPLQDRIDAHARLTIVADDVLHELPFAALWDAGRGRWLVEDHSVRLSDALGGERAAAAAGGAWLAFGDASLAGLEQAPAFAWTRAGGDRLGPLPGARREVEALAQLHPRLRSLLGSDASESSLKAAATDAEVVHLAVHTLVDPASPLESALLLAPGGEDNGLLQVWEVLEQLRLRARLVVLSGCETALGGGFDGEGVVGFVRAFRGAGAHSVVASLWPTHDAATAELVQRFYAARADAGDPAAALRAAQLQMLGTRPEVAGDEVRAVGALAPARTRARLDHPWYWAALQVHEG